jgi:hypothetical protein
MEPRGIFSMAVPAEVLAAALAEDAGSQCPRLFLDHGRRSSHAEGRKTDLLLFESLLAYGCGGL